MLAIKILLNRDRFMAPIQIVPRPRQHQKLFIPGQQKHVPCFAPSGCESIYRITSHQSDIITETASSRSTTQTPFIAGPLAASKQATVRWAMK